MTQGSPTLRDHVRHYMDSRREVEHLRREVEYFRRELNSKIREYREALADFRTQWDRADQLESQLEAARQREARLREAAGVLLDRSREPVTMGGAEMVPVWLSDLRELAVTLADTETNNDS